MKRPNDAFIGTMIGLMLVLFVPNDHWHSDEELFLCLVLFAGLGVVIATVVGRLRHRRS